MKMAHPGGSLTFAFEDPAFLRPGNICFKENFCCDGNFLLFNNPFGCFSKYKGSPYIIVLAAPPASTMAMNTGVMYHAAP